MSINPNSIDALYIDTVVKRLEDINNLFNKVKMFPADQNKINTMKQYNDLFINLNKLLNEIKHEPNVTMIDDTVTEAKPSPWSHR